MRVCVCVCHGASPTQVRLHSALAQQQAARARTYRLGCCVSLFLPFPAVPCRAGPRILPDTARWVTAGHGQRRRWRGGALVLVQRPQRGRATRGGQVQAVPEQGCAEVAAVQGMVAQQADRQNIAEAAAAAATAAAAGQQNKGTPGQERCQCHIGRHKKVCKATHSLPFVFQSLASVDCFACFYSFASALPFAAPRKRWMHHRRSRMHG